MNKPILVYSGHSYHRVTGSTAFFLELLARHYQLSVIWDEAWQPSGAPLKASQINSLNPDIVLFFQTLPKRRELRKIRCKQLVLVPMHDQVVGKSLSSWRKVRASGLRVINFCRATHAIFSGLGFESLYLQYWQPRLAQNVGINETPKIFFWARKGNIGWPLLKSLLGEQRPERIVFRPAADPGESLEMPSADEIREYRIEVITGWLDKARYLELLTSCNVFMAPRLYEGIGQSFLEAMSLGLAVIAPDSPTMNEYIQHGRNGYLYAVTSPTQLDFSKLGAIREQALQDVSAGFLAWQAQESALLAYLSSPAKTEQGFIWRLRGMLSIGSLVDRFFRRAVK